MAEVRSLWFHEFFVKLIGLVILLIYPKLLIQKPRASMYSREYTRLRVLTA